MKRLLLVGCTSALLLALYLSGQALSISRGPYLQLGTPTSVVVRWRTNLSSTSRVCHGPTSSSLPTCVDNGVSTAEHIVSVGGLQPDTTYYYSVGTTSGQVLAGGDATHFFVTSPSTGTSKATRVAVFGDSGTANASAAAVRDAYLNFTGTRHTDLWLMLGDNAYPNGTDSEYQAAVFDMYPTLLRKSVLWPTLGNHDGQSADSPTQTGPYYDIFTLPTSAQAGGSPSGTEAYYSFDYGNIHFICLDSYDTSRANNGVMDTWMQSDLNSTLQPWIVAFWHHPPYSKGSHNSDTESELIDMRANFLPDLEAAGVDLVLTGHSHSYERSFLIDSHYGLSTTFTNSMKKDSGSGREGGTGAYIKPTQTKGAHEGAVYAVAGSSGQTGGGTLNHPAMYISLNQLGSMVLDFNGNRLDARFLNSSGVSADTFTILKGVLPPVPAAPSGLTATAVSSSQINLAWTDNSHNELQFKIERSTDNVNFAQIATVGGSVTSYSNTGLSSATTYYYRVRSSNAGGDSGASNTASATTQGAVPAAPSNLSASGVSPSQINLTWTQNSSNETGFKIERSTNGTNFTQIATVGVDVTSYSDTTGLSPNTRYYYRVRAYNGLGDSAYSNTANAKTKRR